MATVVKKQVEAEAFDRSPYIFEKIRVDDYGNERRELFYSVAGRMEEFHFLYPDGHFLTSPVEFRCTPNFAMFKCEVFLKKGEAPDYVGYATRELVPDTEVGRRFYESAETASIGRALKHLGIGADAFIDEMDAEENRVTGGAPAAPPADAPKEAPKAPAPEAPKKEAPKQDKPQAPASMEEIEKMAKEMKHEDALHTVINSTASKTLKGKTFAVAIGKVSEPEKFKAFLTELSENEKAKTEERVAAYVILSSYNK